MHKFIPLHRNEAEAEPICLKSGGFVGAAFVTAIAILLLVGGYVVSRLTAEKAHREKWKDYNDCGWA